MGWHKTGQKDGEEAGERSGEQNLLENSVVKPNPKLKILVLKKRKIILICSVFPTIIHFTDYIIVYLCTSTPQYDLLL